MRFIAKHGVLATALITIVAAAACDQNRLLDVKTPNAVPVDLFNNPKNAQLMVNSAIGDFECAAGAAILIEGIISDELADSQLGAAQWPYDRRDANTQTSGVYGTSPCTSSQGPGIYTPLSTARWATDTAVARLTAWTDADVSNRALLIAQMNLYAGFSYALLGVSMCKAAFDLGAPVDQNGMFALAEQRFTAAITGATNVGNTNILNAALVGRARVRLYLGKTPEAIADAKLVPKGFVYNVATDQNDPRRYNKVYYSTGFSGNYTVDSISLNLKTENGEVDPRSAVNVTTTRPADSKSVIIVPKKYTALTTPLPLARYEEAQLILAEAKPDTAVAVINAMRATVSLLPYTGPIDATSLKNLTIDERRRVLFVEGLRNYDMQRFNIVWPAKEAPGAPYPRVGGVYGTTTCLPLPDVERLNNPNASGG